MNYKNDFLPPLDDTKTCEEIIKKRIALFIFRDTSKIVVQIVRLMLERTV